MPKAYVPTGNPRGRPKAVTAETPVIEPVNDVVAMLKQTTVDRAHRPMNAICGICYPDGWPQGQRTAGCPHGTWVLR